MNPIRINGLLIRNPYLLELVNEICEIQKIENEAYHKKGKLRNDVFGVKLLTALENGKA